MWMTCRIRLYNCDEARTEHVGCAAQNVHVEENINPSIGLKIFKENVGIVVHYADGVVVVAIVKRFHIAGFYY